MVIANKKEYNSIDIINAFKKSNLKIKRIKKDWLLIELVKHLEKKDILVLELDSNNNIVGFILIMRHPLIFVIKSILIKWLR
jgi:hypothetical protein